MSNPQEEIPEFNGQALATLSPFKILSWRTEDRPARLTGKIYTSHIATCHPSGNPTTKFQTRMFQTGKDQIRAILFLNKNALIQATQNGKSTIFSGVLPPS